MMIGGLFFCPCTSRPNDREVIFTFKMALQRPTLLVNSIQPSIL